MRDQREYLKRYYQEHKIERLAAMKTYALKHPEKNKQYTANYRKNYPERRAFSNILQRCNNPNNRAYPHYSGRGIKCLLESVYDIIEDIGLRPSTEHSIDRINNNGHYCIGNIRWATKREQALNRRNSRN